MQNKFLGKVTKVGEDSARITGVTGENVSRIGLTFDFEPSYRKSENMFASSSLHYPADCYKGSYKSLRKV